MPDPVYATPFDMWQMALPPDTLFQDQSIEPGTWTDPVKTGTGSGLMSIFPASNPRSDFSVVVRCISMGEVNVYGVINPGNPPRFLFSLDHGVTFSHDYEPVSVGSLGNGNYAYGDLAYGSIAYQKAGFTVRFLNGNTPPSFSVGDEWEFSTQASPDIVRSLNTASRFMDGYLSNTYGLPLTSWDDDIRYICCQLARWFLISRRGLDKGQDMEIYNPKDAFAWLTRVGKGDFQARVKEKGNGFLFSQFVRVRYPFSTKEVWRF